ncbi:cadherin EGF LAG seven-pass G-type receptor 1 isoform X1 [Pseudochaenichthys georgianus]|uniref:cadherin EGF LAG seven-pass G-type receptor 1 isoform X1 n=1 Tax=Pseudochaenichthys georgianus TaxID=52239 RepID=UPI00146D350D|nr:cadherin EGF LAG seven-pass G-type receptor 1 isoform X1 [Pseudochaenichthys georgianus]
MGFDRFTSMELPMFWIWVCVLFNVQLSGCLEIHLSDTLQPGTLLANLSLGPGWTSKLDRTLSPKFIQSFFQVGRHDGVIRLSHKVECAHTPRNPAPVYFRTGSLTSGDVILTQFNVFVHGQDCFIKYKRKKASGKPDIHIKHLSKLEATSCLSAGKLLLNVTELLPAFTRNTAFLDTLCVGKDLSAVFRRGDLFLASDLCIEHRGQPELSLHCALQSSPGGRLSVQLSLTLVKVPKQHGSLSETVQRKSGTLIRRAKRQANAPPKFQLPNYQVSLPENEPAGTRVITLKATDPDDGEAGRLEYSMEALFDSRSNDFLEIDSQTGSITTVQSLDREVKDTHVFKVIVTDYGSPQRSATSYLTITVSDTNDHSPVFEQTEYRVSIRENVEVGFEVITIRATDGDAPSNANMIYKIVNGDGVNSVFEIDSRNGVVKIKERPDRETRAQYQLTVEANDQGKEKGPRSATATVKITVEDENDNYPQFTEKRYVVQIPENVAVNTNIIKVEATDKDEGNNAKVQYSIISGNVRGQFYIHSPTGVIDIINPLDYEMIREYNLRIKAQDGGRPPLINGTGMVVVQVVDVNDNVPMFVSTPFQATVLENVAIGYSVIHIQAIDGDAGENARLEYRLTDTTPGFPFTINNSTGWITVSEELDRETTDFYTFGVEARDHGIPVMSSSASVSITVLDVNDNIPTFTEKVYSLKINEDAVVGTSVLTVTAVDRDVNSVVTYQISSGNTRNRFAITSQSGGGLITLALPLDYKQERQYVLTVTASDGTQYDTAQVFLNVTDANTHRPVFQSANYQVMLSEEKPVGSTVVVISATDEDTGENARITYVMEDNVPQFKIDPDTGAITTQMELDYEDQASYTLAIIARDNGIPQKSDTTYVEIIIADANDNTPQFLRDRYQGTVLEDAPVRTSVLQISASDRDSGPNGRLSYTFQDGDDGDGDFFIESSSGIIRTSRKLDRENVPVYNLKAYAVDRGVPQLKAAVPIHVVVQDINDNAPVFEKDELFIDVEENSPVGSVVARISATDPDEGTNAQIMYQIVEGNNPEVFQLDIFNGDLTALIDLDYETKTEYVIVVQATSAPLVSRATVHIRLKDMNDNEPVLHNFEIIFNNYITNKSNSFPSGIIGKVPAHDPDVSDKLRYKFESGNELNLLLLNADTGDLRLSRDLDNDRTLEAPMTISVSDGIHHVVALCTLRVTIITDDMLTNSITVRLENMSQERFLSPLLSLFLEGVAAVLSTTREAVFVFNIQNDTDVQGSILNVTFSALQPGGAAGKGTFFPSEELQEHIYLNRTLLRLISSQEVLPFDDNICLREPCENYMKCVSVLKFDSSPPFIASDTVLFRPIHPINGLRCRCPLGFTGDYCETEIDLCYSGPCKNNGRCRSREGGYTCECQEDFTGEHCELNASSGRCEPGVCKNGGMCVNRLAGGFMCQCPQGEFENPYCEMTTRSFPGQSFITFRGLRQRFHFTVSFTFASRERNALLLYNGRFNEKHDFIALEIIDEQIQLTFSGGETKTTVSPYIPGGVSDGQWHSVQLHYYNKEGGSLMDSSGALRLPLYTAWLELNQKEPNIGRLGIPHGPSGEKVAVVAVDDCDISMAIRFGKQIGNYSCAAQGTQTGQKKSLDLTGPLLLGGVPNLPEDFPVRNREFVGCMRNLTIDSKPIDMASYIANNGTAAGCPAKKNFCTDDVCQNGGVCVSKWSTYSCDCPTGYGGKNCEQVMPSPQFFDGQALISWSEMDITVAVPWYMGLMFRTRQPAGTLMQVNAGAYSTINLMVSEQQVRMEVFLRDQLVASLSFPKVRVNDGEWHHLLVELRSVKDGKDIKYMASVSLDYGVYQQKSVEIGNELPGLKLQTLHLGGLPGDGNHVRKGFVGCIQGVRMGETSTNIANVNMAKGLKIHVEDGCDVADPCDSNICPENSHCSDDWSTHTCVCDPGYFGKECVDACQLNPCEHVSTCVRKPSSSHGYTCDCGQNHFGQYCENKVEKPCPQGWWGSPMCGPCHCDTNRGFHKDCNKTTGECRCKENHYRPEGEDTCYPCECFSIGSESRTCDAITGQCPCKGGVIGRQCNRCHNPFAEVTPTGCEVVYEVCPKAFDADIWWPKTKFGRPAAINCPKGSIGTAIRHCSEEKGWLSPELFNCTTVTFSHLKKLNEDLRRNSSRMDSEHSKTIVRMLHSATNNTQHYYGNDVKTAAQLLNHVLQYESRQAGFDLTAMRDAEFNENLVRAGSAILDPNTKEHWDQIQKTEGGTAHLLHNFEEYTNTLAQNVRKTYLKPFTIVTDNMILTVDYLDVSDPERATLPRFQDIQEEYSKELGSSVHFPQFNLRTHSHRVEPTPALPTQTDAQQEEEQTVSDRKRRYLEPAAPLPVAVVIVYKTLGKLLPERYDPDRRSMRIPNRPVINTAIVSASVHSEGPPLPAILDPPITLEYTMLETEERTKPVCVFWNHSIAIGGTGGWSAKGCEVLNRNNSHISCQCNHMTSFAVLMDISKREHGDVLPLKIVTYTTVSVSLFLLLLTFILLCLLRRLRSNLHAIHRNLVAALFFSELVFLLGINQTDNPFVCTVIAILLHYFYMCTFAWMFVEGLHIYRMLTELRNINHGHMRFYYAMGWGIPAIITGLAVGLDPQGYGNPDFCWLSVHDTLIWSFAGPIFVVVLVNIVIFILAAKASCGRRQKDVEKSGAIPALRMAFLLLLFISATWMLGLLAVNSDVMTFHYLFAVFSCLQGVFIFFFHIIFNREVRRNLKNIFTGKKSIQDESSTTRASLLTRSLNCNNTYTEDGALYRSGIGESTVSLDSTLRSAKSRSSYLAYTLREESGQKPSVSSGTAKGLAHTDLDGPLFHRKGTKGDDSDSDSELSGDEHSSSYASSHSSDSEEDDIDLKPKWNNERQPVHSTPKGACPVESVSNHVKPYWPADATTASDSEDPGANRLRVETKVNVELHQENKLNHTGERERETPAENARDAAPASTPHGNRNHHPEQRKGILKNKISYPPPLTDKNMKNRLREKLSDYNTPTITSSPPNNNHTSSPALSSVNIMTPSSRPPSLASNDGSRPGNHDNGSIIKPPVAPRPQISSGPPPPASYRETNGGVAMHLKSGTVNGDNESDSEKTQTSLPL